MDLTFLAVLFCCLGFTVALQPVQWRSAFGHSFEAGNVSYYSLLSHPVETLVWPGEWNDEGFVATVMQTNATVITAAVIEDTLRSYVDNDDVFSMEFTKTVLIKTPGVSRIDPSGLDYLASVGSARIMVERHCSTPSHEVAKTATYNGTLGLPPGPYSIRRDGRFLGLFKVYRLYQDVQRTFLYGALPREDGTGAYMPLDVSLPPFGYPVVPVPSRLYSWNDRRPFAGFRVAVKDLFDMKGLVTTAGSRAWREISTATNETAPAIQRITDLGGVLVGRYKLAQFASGAEPWQWQDEHYPFNVRGDGWLTCSASSSGGGCSIAAYDWLDFAIGTDTGESIRVPAAVSGTYGQRPSQGMITLERVLPGGAATDTAGVFSRDPHQWAYFSKHWYSPDLHQAPNITGLSPLEVPDTDDFPKTILYPVDFLPLKNPAAQTILETFIGNLSSLFGMQVKYFNLSATVANASNPAVSNLTRVNAEDGPLEVIGSYTQYEAVGRPLISQWAEMFGGRFPPIDPTRREFWHNYNESLYTREAYDNALRQRNEYVKWWESHIQYSTPKSCSESVMLYECGTGGLPSYREEMLNYSPNATLTDRIPEGATIDGPSICPLYACADFTIPIGQVPYRSEVTYHDEMVPVTINMVVKRGCDFVLYNMIERLADVGVLKTVKTGRTAY